MTAERSNTKVHIQGGNRISDYDRALRSAVTQRPIYNDQIATYVQRKVVDSVVRDRVLAEVAKFPSHTGNFLFQRIDSIITKIQNQVNDEKAALAGKFKQIQESKPASVDSISDIYASLTSEENLTEPLEKENDNE